MGCRSVRDPFLDRPGQAREMTGYAAAAVVAIAYTRTD